MKNKNHKRKTNKTKNEKKIATEKKWHTHFDYNNKMSKSISKTHFVLFFFGVFSTDLLRMFFIVSAIYWVIQLNLWHSNESDWRFRWIHIWIECVYALISYKNAEKKKLISIAYSKIIVLNKSVLERIFLIFLRIICCINIVILFLFFIFHYCDAKMFICFIFFPYLNSINIMLERKTRKKQKRYKETKYIIRQMIII